jgi:hypothetical protein
MVISKASSLINAGSVKASSIYAAGSISASGFKKYKKLGGYIPTIDYVTENYTKQKINDLIESSDDTTFLWNTLIPRYKARIIALIIKKVHDKAANKDYKLTKQSLAKVYKAKEQIHNILLSMFPKRIKAFDSKLQNALNKSKEDFYYMYLQTNKSIPKTRTEQENFLASYYEYLSSIIIKFENEGKTPTIKQMFYDKDFNLNNLIKTGEDADKFRDNMIDAYQSKKYKMNFPDDLEDELFKGKFNKTYDLEYEADPEAEEAASGLINFDVGGRKRKAKKTKKSKSVKSKDEIYQMRLKNLEKARAARRRNI